MCLLQEFVWVKFDHSDVHGKRMKKQYKHGHSELIWKVTQILAKIFFSAFAELCCESSCVKPSVLLIRGTDNISSPSYRECLSLYYRLSNARSCNLSILFALRKFDDGKSVISPQIKSFIPYTVSLI